MSTVFDVLIVGAGLSGIGAARHFQREAPEKRFAILEGRQSIGGTWDLFRYPGVRSDSDMFTLGYEFKPWKKENPIASGEGIWQYIDEAAKETGVQEHIRLGHRVTHASWSSKTALWTLTVLKTATGETEQMQARFVMMCSGYYDYESGFSPNFPGRENFQGEIIHPQFWPKNFNYENKRIVVIGSGATAMTLIPNLTDKAQSVTMLQRSPTYVVNLPSKDPLGKLFRALFSESRAYKITRGRNLAISGFIYKLCRRYPQGMAKFLIRQAKRQLPEGFDMKHFTPAYAPWDQRLCVVPDGDLFKAIRNGKAAVVTDHIDTFTANGIRLKSGEELPADIVVTATGLNLKIFGGMTGDIDGKTVEPTEHYNYKGMMFSEIPNLSFSLGYTNASWTLKADLIAKYVIRLIKHMDATNTQICAPRLNGKTLREAPFMDMTSGYFERAKHVLPKGCDEDPWKLYNDYKEDRRQLLEGSVVDNAMEFTRAKAT